MDGCRAWSDNLHRCTRGRPAPFSSQAEEVDMRTFLFAFALVAMLGGSLSAAEQVYPAHPVRLVVGYSPGLTPDIVARLMAQSLSERFGQQFIVDNRPGAASKLGTETAVHAAAD